jgi:hypothetical protein
MAILNLDGGGSRGPRFGRPKIWLGIAIIAGVLGIGSTLASTITLNSGTPTEFGQGATRTVYCGGSQESLTITPIAGYSNAAYVPQLGEAADSDTATAYAGSFVMSGFKVSDIPEKCSNIDFIISAYGNGTGSSPLSFLGNAETVNGLAVLWEGSKNYVGAGLPCKNPQTSSSVPGCQGAAVRNNVDGFPSSSNVTVQSNRADEFTVSFGNGLGIPTDSLGRLVIETQDDQITANQAVPLS